MPILNANLKKQMINDNIFIECSFWNLDAPNQTLIREFWTNYASKFLGNSFYHWFLMTPIFFFFFNSDLYLLIASFECTTPDIHGLNLIINFKVLKEHNCYMIYF